MISDEYSKALYDIALENKEFDEINSEFDVLIMAINQNKDIFKVMDSSAISNSNKKKVIDNICPNFNNHFKDFLYVLIDNARFNLINDIYEGFTNRYFKKEKIINATIYSANPLTEDYLLGIKEKLCKMFNAKSCILQSVIDEALIGGIKIIYNGKSLDLSLKDKLEGLKTDIR